MPLTKTSSILIATFSPWKNNIRLPINGNLEPLLDFFTNRVKLTTLVDQVYPGSDFVMSKTEIYRLGKKEIKNPSIWMYFLYPFLKLTNTGATHISFKFRDFLSVIDAAYKVEVKYDYFIGLEAINAIAGIFLKKLGKIKNVIYYVSDYTPKRYDQKWFNDLYLSLDRFAAKHSDFIWDVSPAMHPARIENGLDASQSAPVLVVPNALYPTQIKSLPTKDIIPFSIVFMGTLGVENGPDLAIESFRIIHKKYKRARLYIIGGSDRDLKRLKKLAKHLKVADFVIFKGFISDRVKVSEEIRQFSVALAPYKNTPGSARLYGDATKIRAYMAAGLPTITTKVPPLGKIVSDLGAALIVKDSKLEIAEGVMRIFSDPSLFNKMKKNALNFAKNNTWENEFSNAFTEMTKYEKNH